MQKRSARNRNRTKRRQIFCPVHHCYLESLSPKYPLHTDNPEHLQQRGVGRRTSLLLLASLTTVSLKGEWIEAFWCDDCDEKQWYHVHEVSPRCYQLSLAPEELWQQVSGVIHPVGNPSVGEFTRRQARISGYRGIKDFATVK